MVIWSAIVLAAAAVPFNDGWECRREGEAQWRRVTLPHDAAHGRGYERTEDPDQGFVRCPKTTYRKTFARPDGAGRFAVKFDGVYMNSTVSLNGRTVGGRANGFLPFEVPVDGLAATNVIEVACDAATPNARWYVGCGILRDVWLVRREGGFTLEPEDVAVTTELLADGSAVVKVRVDGARVVEPPDGRLVIRQPKLWTPETPNLQYLAVTAENAKGERDTVRIRYGIRTVEFTRDRGMLLNGKPYRIKGLCRHETFGALGGAFHLAATKRELAMCKEMGVNAIRTAHNPFSPRFYDLCDEMGFLVKDEAFDEWRMPKTKNGYSRHFDANWRRDLADFVRRDRNHPCVILWSVGNEIRDHWQGTDGGELTRQMVEAVHALDRSRPVTAGINHPEVAYTNGVIAALDVVGLNYNADWYAKLKGEKPVFGSETAPSLADRDVYLFGERDGRMVPVQATNRLECAYSPKAFTWAAPAEVALVAQRDSPWSAGEFAWCTYDYLGEPNHTGRRASDYWPARSSYWGLCDLAGMRKDRFYLYQSQWSDRPVVHLMPDWTHPGKEGKRFPVWCYTNAREAELFLNGVSQGVRRFADTKDLHLAWDVAYAPGTLEVRAKFPDGRIVTDRRVTAGEVRSLRVTRLFAADGFAWHRIDAVDANGMRAIACEDEVTVTVVNADLAALDNGSPTDQTPFASDTRRLCRGSLVAVVRGNGDEPVLAHRWAGPAKGETRIRMLPDEKWWGLATHFEEEMFVRSAEVHALCGMMQFSASPWRVLGAGNRQIVRDLVKMRQEKFAARLTALAAECGRTGEPMLRNLEYVFPGCGYAEIRDQFVMGYDLMVAPVVEKGARVRPVAIPPGRWRGDDGTILEGPCRISVDAPLSRLPYFERMK